MLHNHWYLICPSNELTRKIRPVKILNEAIVLYRGSDGRLTALEDRCCHRNVHISLGYLDDDRIVCAYHGWEYDQSGCCVRIPSQAPDAKIPKTAKVRTYPVIDFNNWVWVFVGDPERVEHVKPLDIPEMREWPFTYRNYIFKADLESTAESLIDPYHIAFAHRNSIGSFMGQIEEYRPDFNLKFLDDGLEGVYQRANKGNLGERAYFGDQPAHTTYYRFYYPNISRLEIRFKKRTLLILEHVMQVDDEHVSMMQITLWKNIFAMFPAFARWFMRRKSHKIVQEDIELLNSQFRILKQSNGHVHEVSVKDDEISLAFRKFWRRKMRAGRETETSTANHR